MQKYFNVLSANLICNSLLKFKYEIFKSLPQLKRVFIQIVKMIGVGAILWGILKNRKIKLNSLCKLMNTSYWNIKRLLQIKLADKTLK